MNRKNSNSNKNELDENILGIERVNGRIMKIRLATNIHGGK